MKPKNVTATTLLSSVFHEGKTWQIYCTHIILPVRDNRTAYDHNVSGGCMPHARESLVGLNKKKGVNCCSRAADWKARCGWAVTDEKRLSCKFSIFNFVRKDRSRVQNKNKQKIADYALLRTNTHTIKTQEGSAIRRRPLFPFLVGWKGILLKKS